MTLTRFIDEQISLRATVSSTRTTARLLTNESPATIRAVAMLPRVAMVEKGECVICFEEWSKSDMETELPCKHKYHLECVEKWLKIHTSCPQCRYKLSCVYKSFLMLWFERLQIYNCKSCVIGNVLLLSRLHQKKEAYWLGYHNHLKLLYWFELSIHLCWLIWIFLIGCVIPLCFIKDLSTIWFHYIHLFNKPLYDVTQIFLFVSISFLLYDLSTTCKFFFFGRPW